MKIAIIGGGWLGCHIASKLLADQHNVHVYEQSSIFSGASFYNQNRLHKGFHYSRNQKTRKLCYDTFDLFLEDYHHLVEPIQNNYYAIPTDKSLIDYGTFKTIFKQEEVPFTECTIDWLENIEGSVVVDERYINPVKAQQHFDSLLKTNLIIKDIDQKELVELSKDYDYVINVTNNKLKTIANTYYELSLTLVYNKTPGTSFGSLTMVDGPLFSIYPYRADQYTLTDVEYTPVYINDDLEELEKFKRTTLTGDKIDSIRNEMEAKVRSYYKRFKADFNYLHYYTSTKVKRASTSADRSPIIKQEGNIISCVSGKIQGIYTLENYIKNEIARR